MMGFQVICFREYFDLIAFQVESKISVTGFELDRTKVSSCIFEITQKYLEGGVVTIIIINPQVNLITKSGNISHIFFRIKNF